MSIARQHFTDGRDERRAAMAVLAQAQADEIASGLERIGDSFNSPELRPTEIGLVMLRGRIGGDGASFNVGEATVTRAAVRLASGENGFSYVLGRDVRKAQLAALCDALLQTQEHRASIEQHVLTPLRAAQQQQRALKRAQTAATRVDFFTMVRGEDA
jgi:alpha-D-ribose 1-methylphosphonate 5-triphosphate synthase subunit PhnG